MWAQCCRLCCPSVSSRCSKVLVKLQASIPASIQEDLLRRDFTINAIAASIAPDDFGTVSDPLQGLSDLEIGLVRTLHDKSFVDDPTRIIRGIKYVNRFSFVFDHHTQDQLELAIWEDAVKTISPHRLTDELRLLFIEEKPWGAIWDLAQFCVLNSVWCYLTIPHESLPILQKLEDFEAMLTEYLPDDYSIWLARLLLFFANVPPAKIADGLSVFDLNQRESRVVEQFVLVRDESLAAIKNMNSPKDSELYGLFSPLQPEIALTLVALRGKKANRVPLQRYFTRALNVAPELTGDDLIEMGIGPGPAIGEILKRLRLAKIDGEVRTREDERAVAQNILRNLAEDVETERKV